MSRLLYVFAFCLFALPTFCQQRNSKGQKIISKIEAYSQRGDKPYIIIDFKYNSNLELQEVVQQAPASKQTVYWKKQGSALTQKVVWDYQTIYKPSKYTYALTPDGYIHTKTIDDLGIDGSVLRHLYEYHYDAKGTKLSMIYERTFFKERNGKFVELSDRDKTYYGWDSNDNMFKSNIDSYQWKRGQKESNCPIEWKAFKYYDELLNDTNLNLALIDESLRDTNDFVLLTEWVSCHSKHLVENRYYTFTYTFDNKRGDLGKDGDKGNIIQIEVYHLSHLEKVFKLYYMM